MPFTPDEDNITFRRVVHEEIKMETLPCALDDMNHVSFTVIYVGYEENIILLVDGSKNVPLNVSSSV